MVNPPVLHLRPDVQCVEGLTSIPPLPGSPLVDIFVSVENRTSEDVTLFFFRCASSIDFATANRLECPAGSCVLPSLLRANVNAAATQPWSYVAVRYADDSYDVHGLLWSPAQGYSFARATQRYVAGAPVGDARASLLANGPSIFVDASCVGGFCYPWMLDVRLRLGAGERELASLDAFAQLP